MRSPPLDSKDLPVLNASDWRSRLIRAWRVLGWVWRAFWLAVLIALLAFAALSRAAARRLNRQLAARRATGELRPIEQLVPHVPSGAGNAADVYGRAFGALQLSHTQYALLIGTVHPLWQASAKPPSDWTLKEAGLAAAAVAANHDYFRLLDQAAGLPDCAFPVAWHRGHLTSLLHLRDLVTAGLMLRARAFLLAGQGKGDEALAVSATVLRMADHVQMEPDLFSQHSGYRIQACAVDGIVYALQRGRVSPAACQRLAAQLARTDLVPRSRHAMRGEEAIYGLPTFDSARLCLPQDLHLPDLPPRPLAARVAPQYLLNLDELAYLDHVTKAIQALDLRWPAAERMSAETDRRLRRLPAYRGRLTRAVAPPVRPELLLRQVTQAQLGAAQIALLLKACQPRAGRYPASLAALQAAVGKLPLDPFAGTPYRYHRRRAGFIVYSVGPDLRDDGGRPLPQAARAGLEVRRLPDPRERYDLPFTCPR
jgi:hypothetical protein